MGQEHLATEELVFDFKKDYEETRRMLEEKFKESKEDEEIHKEAIRGFNLKLGELQKIIDNLKNIIIAKENKVKKLKEKMNIQSKVNKEEIFIREETIVELNRNIKILKLQNEENAKIFERFQNEEHAKIFYKDDFYRISLNEKDVSINITI